MTTSLGKLRRRSNGVADSEAIDPLEFSAADLVTLAQALGVGARLALMHRFPEAKAAAVICYDSTGGKVEPQKTELKALAAALAKVPGWEVTSGQQNTYAGPINGTYRIQIRTRVAKQQERDWQSGEWKDAGDVKLPAYIPYYALRAQAYPQWHAPTLDDGCGT